MGRPRKLYRCRECGKPCERRGRRQHGVSCIDCAIARYERSNWEIHEKRGEYYEKWLLNTNAAIQRLGREYVAGTTPPDADGQG